MTKLQDGVGVGVLERSGGFEQTGRESFLIQGNEHATGCPVGSNRYASRICVVQSVRHGSCEDGMMLILLWIVQGTCAVNHPNRGARDPCVVSMMNLNVRVVQQRRQIQE